VTGNSVI